MSQELTSAMLRTAEGIGKFAKAEQERQEAARRATHQFIPKGWIPPPATCLECGLSGFDSIHDEPA